jgi:hypothetical protein
VADYRYIEIRNNHMPRDGRLWGIVESTTRGGFCAILGFSFTVGGAQHRGGGVLGRGCQTMNSDFGSEAVAALSHLYTATHTPLFPLLLLCVSFVSDNSVLCLL